MRSRERKAIIVIDLGFGDAGKGTTIDALAARTRSTLTVRFNGGPQAGHNVVLADGRHHTFSQFGSNSFHEGARTLLDRPMLIEPYAMEAEADHLHRVGVSSPLQRLWAHRECRVITPPQQAANQLRELARGYAAHGTCGRGVGECVADEIAHRELTLRARDLSDRETVRRLLIEQRDLKRSELRESLQSFAADPRAALAREVLDGDDWLETAIDVFGWIAHHLQLVDDDGARTMMAGEETVLFEGAQGVLLDEDIGFHPHTTWSRTTAVNAEALLDRCNFDGQRIRLGVTRCYQTRHGAGPIVSEYPPAAAAPTEPHNTSAGWQGEFRTGYFDALLMEYALRHAGPLNGIAVTHLDRMGSLPKGVCTQYDFENAAKGLISIPLINPMDFGARAAQTAKLFEARPVIEASYDNNGFVHWFVERFEQRVVLESFGPTSRDKRWSGDW